MPGLGAASVASGFRNDAASVGGDGGRVVENGLTINLQVNGAVNPRELLEMVDSAAKRPASIVPAGRFFAAKHRVPNMVRSFTAAYATAVAAANTRPYMVLQVEWGTTGTPDTRYYCDRAPAISRPPGLAYQLSRRPT